MDLIQFAIFAIVISVVTWAVLKYATTLPQWAKTGMLHYRPNIGG